MECVLTEAYYQSVGKGFPLERIQEIKADFIRRSQLVEVEEPRWGFASVGGYKTAKRLIEREVINSLKDPEGTQECGLRLPRGILLFGPPGTGKTLFAKALAKELSLPTINFRTENLFSMWLGESGRLFRAAIELVEQMSPAVVFIDEIDRMGRRTGAAHDGASQETQKVFSQVLEWTGKKERRSILVGTTNTPDHLDEALLRAGRFDHIVPFLYPDRQARREILEIHLGLHEGAGYKSVEFSLRSDQIAELLDELADRATGLTGAELEEVIRRARLNWFHHRPGPMTAEDLRRAFEDFHVDLADRQEKRQFYLEQAQRFTRDRTFLSKLVVELREESNIKIK